MVLNKRHKKVVRKYLSSDIGCVIVENFQGMESTEGSPFYATQPIDGVVYVQCADQIFLVSIVEQERLS